MVPQAELFDQSGIQGTFTLSQVSFKFRCIIFMLIVASIIDVWGLEVETLEMQCM